MFHGMYYASRRSSTRISKAIGRLIVWLVRVVAIPGTREGGLFIVPKILEKKLATHSGGAWKHYFLVLVSPGSF